MVISEIIGGLGNQMFQYAAGTALAKRLGVPHLLDLQAFEGGYRLHQYALSHLNIIAPRASVEDITRLRNRRLKALPRFMRPMLESKRTHYRNLSLNFDSRVEQLQAPIYLEGYFQSEKYFQRAEADVRKEFLFKTPPSEENRLFAELISRTTNAIAVHVRRGDYVSDPTTYANHGTCSPQYYLSAMQQLRERAGQISAFVFSDDPDWAEDNLALGVPTCVVRHNPGDKGYEDLRLMTHCKHFIIANSSLSWWGAWLSLHPQKIVIAPKKWMRDSKLNSPDIYPAQWIKVSS